MHPTIRALVQPRLLVFYAIVGLILLSLVGGSFILLQNIHQNEKTRMRREADLAVDAFVAHTTQIISQVDTLLHAVRMFYLNGASLTETDRFIDGLNFDKSIIDNIYLINAKGDIVISHDASAPPPQVTDRDYFHFHQANSSDNLYISAVESGRVTGEYHFRISRRINNPDGSFGGIVLAAVNPSSFTHFYQQLNLGDQNVASLVGALDKRLRARVPEPAADAWAEPIESPLWAALQHSPSGSYENRSPVDQIPRTFVYRKINDLPLVMVVGFSEEDVNRQAAGEVKWVFLVTGSAILVILVATLSLMVVFTNHDRLASANQRLNDLYLQVRELALYDSLTGLPGRVLFSDRLDHALRIADREGRQCSLMYLDLDGFKDVNDTYGHDAGDEFLKVVSSRMQSVLRSTDTLCRWGGDEFIILLLHYNGAGEVFEISRRLLAVIQEPVEVKGAICSVSASIGVAGFPDNGRKPEELHKAADAAMYTAKRQGKAQVVFA